MCVCVCACVCVYLRLSVCVCGWVCMCETEGEREREDENERDSLPHIMLPICGSLEIDREAPPYHAACLRPSAGPKRKRKRESSSHVASTL